MSTAAPADFKTAPAPKDAEGWLGRAAEVAAVLATDAATRDKAAATPYAEVQLLKDSGLVTLLGPVEHGGAGQDWPTAYRVVREVAKADGSIGQLLGYHYLWNWAARLVATREQREQVEAEAARNQWFFGGAVNPRDQDVVVKDEGDTLTFTGRKTFSTIQLVFVSFYLGIAAGALETATTYTRTKSRAWLHGGHEHAVDEPYVIDTYGDVTAKLWAAEALP